jgi:hypothetical protein
MTDPAGSDRLEGDLPQDETVERDAGSPDDRATTTDDDLADVERAGPADGL